jgi:hypothetical protein
MRFAIAAALLVTACSAAIPQDLRVPKLYIKDYSPRIRGEQYAGDPDRSGLTAFVNALQNFGTIGVVFGGNFVGVIDPVLLLHTTEPVTMPADQLVDEPYFEAGEWKTKKVLRKPIFYVDRVTVTYQVPGVDIAPVVIEQNVPIKSNDHLLEPLPIAQVGALFTSFQQKVTSGTASAVSGTVTTTFDVRDMDPLASERTFKVARTFPFLYTYQILVNENIEVQAPTNSPAPSASPSAAPAASPSPSASPSAQPALPSL